MQPLSRLRAQAPPEALQFKFWAAQAAGKKPETVEIAQMNAIRDTQLTHPKQEIRCLDNERTGRTNSWHEIAGKSKPYVYPT